jgi:hypothetical protein
MLAAKVSIARLTVPGHFARTSLDVGWVYRDKAEISCWEGLGRYSESLPEMLWLELPGAASVGHRCLPLLTELRRLI